MSERNTERDDARHLAYDEGAMAIVAEAIYCVAHPELASVWNVECEEIRRHYMDLASAAFLASLTVLRP